MWRGADETHVAVDLGDDQVEDIVVVEADDAHLAVRICLLGGGDQRLAVGACGDLVRHVRHALQETHGQARAGEFFLPRHGEVAVFQVVVLRGGEGLDVAVAAMVVGHEQAASGDELAGTASAELDDGILDGGMVDAVDLVRSEPGAEVVQGLAVHLLEQRKEPHSLVGAQGGRHEQQSGGNGKEKFLHIANINIF